MPIYYTVTERPNPLKPTEPAKFYATAKALKKTELDEIAKDIARGSTTVSEADVRAELDKLPHKIVLNVDKVAKEIGSIRVANIVLLGATIPFLGIDYEKIQTSIREIFERKGEAIVEMNLKALAAGKEIAEKLM